MNRKFIIAWIIVFFAWFVGSFIVHGILLRPDYMQLCAATPFRGGHETNRL